MKRALLLPLIFAGACSSAPPPPPQPLPPPDPPPKAIVAPPPWIELTEEKGDAVVRGYASGGEALYTVRLPRMRGVTGASDGGAWAIVDAESKSGSRHAVRLIRIHPDGRQGTTAEISPAGWTFRLLEAGGRVFAFDLGSESSGAARRLHLFDADKGTKLREADLPRGLTDVAGSGGVVVVAEGDRLTRWTTEGQPGWSVRLRVFPTSDSSERSHVRLVAVNATGTVLTGADDGSLVALDQDGKPLYQLGVRGPIDRIEARTDGDFIVRAHERATVIGPLGVVRRELADSAEPAPQIGVLDKRRRLPAPSETEGEPEAPSAPVPPASPSSAALAIAGPDASHRLERVVVSIDGGRPLRGAIDIAATTSGAVWLHEGPRVIEYDGSRARVLYQAPKPEQFKCWYAPEPDCNLCANCNERRPPVLECSQCMAPAAAGEGSLLTEEGWRSARAGATQAVEVKLAPARTIAAAPSGDVWAVAANPEEKPGLLIDRAGGDRVVPGLSPAAYADIAVRADDDGWLAGGLTSFPTEAPGRLEGEGTLVHYDGHAFTRHRAPDGALLSVAAVGPGEAWAVGLDGGVLHVREGVSSALHLTLADGTRVRAILRSVAATGPKDVWISGDGWLLRWDGAALRRVDTSAAGPNVALSALIAPSGEKPGWVVGPSGIWKIVPVK